jgi:hypothetical protein
MMSFGLFYFCPAHRIEIEVLIRNC